MPVPPNTSLATAVAMVVNTPHTTVAADIELAPNGTGFTTNCVINNPQKNVLWYKYTVPSGVNIISFGLKGVPEYPVPNYVPYVSIWTETSPGVYTQFKVSSNQYCNKLVANGGIYCTFQVPGNPGTVFYFQVQNNGTGTIDYGITALVTHPPTGTAVAGDIMIPDDLGPFPAAILDKTTGIVKGYIAYGKNWSGEDFSIIQQGGWLLNSIHENGPLKGRAVECFGPPPNHDLIATVDLTSWSFSNNSVRDVVSDQVSKHYVITSKSSEDYIHKIDAITGTKEVTWLVPGRIMNLIGVHTASGVAYYTDYNNYSTVHRMDMNTGLALTDFLPDNGKYRAEGFVLPDGTVGIATQDVETTWDIYSPGGTKTVSSFTREYHRFSLDNTLNGIYFWEAYSRAAFSFSWIETLDEIEYTITSPGPVISSSGGPILSYDDNPWGYSDSCPVTIYPLTVEPPPPGSAQLAQIPLEIIVMPTDISGIYFINPTKATKHDSYYNDVEKKIPNPTIKTALIGD